MIADNMPLPISVLLPGAFQKRRGAPATGPLSWGVGSEGWGGVLGHHDPADPPILARQRAPLEGRGPRRLLVRSPAMARWSFRLLLRRVVGAQRCRIRLVHGAERAAEALSEAQEALVGSRGATAQDAGAEARARSSGPERSRGREATGDWGSASPWGDRQLRGQRQCPSTWPRQAGLPDGGGTRARKVAGDHFAGTAAVLNGSLFTWGWGRGGGWRAEGTRGAQPPGFRPRAKPGSRIRGAEKGSSFPVHTGTG